jgi:putative transcriptional regulator
MDFRNAYVVIHVKLLELLESNEKSQYWLAKQTGMTPQTVAKLCKGKTKGIDFLTLNSICKALGCQASDVLVYVPDDHKK